MSTRTFSMKQIMKAAPKELKSRYTRALGMVEVYMAKFMRCWQAGEKGKADKYRRASIKARKVADNIEQEAIKHFKKKMAAK